MKTVDFLRDKLHIENERLLHKVLTICEVNMVKKREYLIRQGEKPSALYFLMNGVFRGFLVGINGKDITDCIVEQSGMPIMPSSDLKAPAPIGIEALVDSTVLSISPAEFDGLLKEFPVVHTMYRDFILRSCNMHWELKIITYQYTAMQRYHWFLKNYPGLIDKISHKYIASFLNMTPVTLSRLVNLAGKKGDEEQLDVLLPEL